MSGAMSYVEAFEKRINLLSPSQEQFCSFLHLWKPILSPGVQQFIEELKEDSKQIVLISGGIYEVRIYNLLLSITNSLFLQYANF